MEKPLNPPTRRHEIVSTCSACGRQLVQEVSLADANLGCRFDSSRDEPGVLSFRQREELPALLDFSIDIEQILASGDSPQQDRPKGKVLKFEVPVNMKAMPPANLVNSSNSTGTAAEVIEFRRPEAKRASSETESFDHNRTV
jgi:hypothetical protein